MFWKAIVCVGIAVAGVAVGAETPAGPVAFGEVAAIAPLPNADGEGKSLEDFGEHPAYVLFFFGNTCPVAQRYTGVMVDLAKSELNKQVQFIAVNVSGVDTNEEIRTYVEEYGITFPVLVDAKAALAKQLGVTRTPEVVVLDKEKRMRYRGRIDDQFRLGGVRPSPTREDLRVALEELLAGKPVSVQETKADGCKITFPDPEPQKDDKPAKL